MSVEHSYIPMRKTRMGNHGLSEHQIKARLEREGWEVWRGGLLHMSRKAELYPNVERKYRRLAMLIEADYPGKLELLQYLCVVHHGMPDYLCFRSKNGRREWKFVECKFLHEQLSARQKACIPKLQGMGFVVEVHKIVDHRTTARSAEVDLESGKRRVKELQLRLNSRRIKEATRRQRP